MSTLKNVFSRGFPGQNLFEISLVEDTDPNAKLYKSRTFCFLNCSPGSLNPETNMKTFLRDSRISLKADLEKVTALAYQLRMAARGNNDTDFKIISDSSKSTYTDSSDFKMCFVTSFTSNKNEKKVGISFKSGQNQPISAYTGTTAETLAVADTIEFIAKMGLKREYEIKSSTNKIGKVNNTNQQPSPPPPVNTIPDDDDIPF